MITFKLHKVEYGDNYKCVQWVYSLDQTNNDRKKYYDNCIYWSYIKGINNYKRNKYANMKLWHDNDICSVTHLITMWTNTFIQACKNKHCMNSMMGFLPMQLEEMKILDTVDVIFPKFKEDMFDEVLDKMTELMNELYPKNFIKNNRL